MKKKRKKRRVVIPPEMQDRINELEQKASTRGIFVHYDLLEAAGLKLKGGMCRIKGEYHLFIDRRKSPADRIEILNEYLENPLPQDIPEVSE